MTAAVSTPPDIPPAAVQATAAQWPRVTVRPAPRREPPFDDELAGPPARGAPEPRLPFAVGAAQLAWAPRPARSHGLPDPQTWGRRLVVGLIETSAGRRPLAQLAPMLSPSVNRGLGDTFERAAQQGSAHWLHRASVRSVRASEPVEGVAELCATVDTGARVRAIALRLEEYRGHWRCVRLQLG